MFGGLNYNKTRMNYNKTRMNYNKTRMATTTKQG
jgi:hypothetical protein